MEVERGPLANRSRLRTMLGLLGCDGTDRAQSQWPTAVHSTDTVM